MLLPNVLPQQVQLAAADAELQQAARDKLQVQLELSQAQVRVLRNLNSGHAWQGSA
jgi:hypothetical protein